MFRLTRRNSKKLPLVILHIGTEKTGTTSIQQFIYKNRHKLAKQDIHTLSGFGKPNNREFVAFFQKSLDDWAKAKGIKSRKEMQTYFLNFEPRFARDVRRKKKEMNSPVFIITSEHFSSRLRTMEELESVRDFLMKYFDKVRIICYFRPQVEMATSLHSTGLREQSSLSLEKRLKSVVPENYYYNFHEVAKLWSSVFGKENLRLRIFHRKKLVAEDVRHDFLYALKSTGVVIDSRKLHFNIAPANESLSPLQGGVYAAINEAIPYWRVPPFKGSSMVNLRLKRATWRIPTLATGRYLVKNATEIQSRFSSSNRKFFDEFLNGESFDLEGLKETVDSLPIKEVERLIYELTKTLLSQRVSLDNPKLFGSDADYLRDVAISVLDKKPLNESHAADLLELALRAKPEDPIIQKQLLRARTEITQN